MIYNTDDQELETYDGPIFGWEAVGADAQVAAGTTGQVQYNNGGQLGADAGLTYIGSSGALAVGTSITTPLIIGGTTASSKLTLRMQRPSWRSASLSATHRATLSKVIGRGRS